MKIGVKSNYVITIHTRFGVAFKFVTGRKIIFMKNNELLYVCYRKNGKVYEFTEVTTGMLIISDGIYKRGVKRISYDFDNIINQLNDRTKYSNEYLEQVKMSNEIFGTNSKKYLESAVISVDLQKI